MNRKVYVVGAGISGLTTAVVLQEAGYRVEIFAEYLPMATNSARAGAIWFPTRVGPPDRVAVWGKRTYERFEEMAGNAVAGVEMVEVLLMARETKGENPYWVEAVQVASFRKASPEELPTGHGAGYCVRVPFVEPGIYLPYLVDRFLEGGGKIMTHKVENWGDSRLSGGQIVNCSGLGAAQLAGDDGIFPIYGHTLRTSSLESDSHLINDISPNELSYIFSRSQDTLLGGTATEKPDLDQGATFQSILERAKKLNPAVASVEVLGQSVAARPYRSAIRLERDPQGIIHNYGHGGSGFTVSWGCAEDVLRLLQGN